ncbi:MAG: DNA-binding transcriptional activator PspC [Methanoregulaceae archaeon PtaB.Bin056]|jgi:phage shock protein PspC (stress-responsive transcriptional regulator)|nr:MAG: DNA-binding transcriptional activator PspC [Methanoregulaceae archaeon PtaB.Bin056]
MKRLMRMKEGKLLGGVCGGIGIYFEVDPVVIRILWVVLTLLSVGIGVIVYIAAWLLMPEEGEAGTATQSP